VQNTNTGKLTEKMFLDVFTKARKMLAKLPR
jgi:uracil-DNA glycosylase